MDTFLFENGESADKKKFSSLIIKSIILVGSFERSAIQEKGEGISKSLYSTFYLAPQF